TPYAAAHAGSMATIRDKSGHRPSLSLQRRGGEEFVSSLITRTRCPSQRANPALRVGQRALLFKRSRRSLTHRRARAGGEVRSRWPTLCEHDASGPDGAPVISAGPEPTLGERCADRLQRRKGPSRRESL